MVALALAMETPPPQAVPQPQQPVTRYKIKCAGPGRRSNRHTIAYLEWDDKHNEWWQVIKCYHPGCPQAYLLPLAPGQFEQLMSRGLLVEWRD